MNQYQNTNPEPRDPQLWEMARRRASFKTHFATYIVINIIIWLVWLLTDRDHDGNGLPWPVWSTFGWGIGVIFHYLSAYVFPKAGSAEREYEKLKEQQRK
jgi:hypothetical protein